MRPTRFLALPAVVCAVAVFGVTSTSTIAASRAGSSSAVVTASQLAPFECASLALTGVVVGSGNVNGVGSGDLILGSPAADRIRGRGGNDCIVGGAGDDDINGNGGTDVCMGGPGVDSFKSCSLVYQ